MSVGRWIGHWLGPQTRIPLLGACLAQLTIYWAPQTQKRHQQEHRPQRLTESSDPTQHAEGRTGDCPGPRKGTTTRRNVTQGVFKQQPVMDVPKTPHRYIWSALGNYL